MSEFSRHDIRRILVRSVNWVGDAVLTLPALDALDRRFPEAEIAVLARPWVADLFRDQPAVDRVIAYERAEAGTCLGPWRLARRLRAQGFDLALLFPNAFEAAWVAWLAGIPRRAGYSRDGRRVLLTHPLPQRARGGHQVQRYLDLVRALGGEGDPVPRLRTGDRARAAAGRLLSEHGLGAGEPAVALNPGSVYGGAKRWPAPRFAAAADALAARGARILLVGSGREARILEEVAGRMSRAPAVLAGRTDLPTLAAVLERCDLLLTNDTGAMHLARAVRTPVVAVFGPTDADATGPIGPGGTVVRHAVACSPCLYRECPIDHRCMRGVPVERVVEACVAAMRGRGDGQVEMRGTAEGRGSDEERGAERASADGDRGGRPAAFLDRDGTIIEDLGYLADPEQIRLIPGAVEALHDLQRAGYRLVLITNQAGVARGLITEQDVQRVNAALVSRLAAAGVTFDGVYYCPHHPEHGPAEYRVACECRKPGPGMVRRAVEEYGLDPARSVIVGDHSTDTLVARQFPGMRGVLVRTGHGAGQAEKIRAGELEPPDHVAADLSAAVRWLLAGAEERDALPTHPA
jgi:heptosyltransferase-2